MKDGGAAAFFLIWKLSRAGASPPHLRGWLGSLISVLFSADKCSL